MSFGSSSTKEKLPSEQRRLDATRELETESFKTRRRSLSFTDANFTLLHKEEPQQEQGESQVDFFSRLRHGLFSDSRHSDSHATASRRQRSRKTPLPISTDVLGQPSNALTGPLSDRSMPSFKRVHAHSFDDFDFDLRRVLAAEKIEHEAANFKPPEHLKEEVEDVLRDHQLSELLWDAGPSQLPVFMRAADGFGCHNRPLRPEEYVRWHARCIAWAERMSSLRHTGANRESLSVSLEKIDGSKMLVLIAQGCPRMHTLSLRGGRLTDAALQEIAVSMRSRLKSLDLHQTRGFGDRGLKALAAFCTGLEVLRVGGCAVSDEGIEKVAMFCAKLRVLEVPESSAVSPGSLSHLSERCTVERSTKPPAQINGAPRVSTERSSDRLSASSSDRMAVDEKVEGGNDSSERTSSKGLSMSFRNRLGRGDGSPSSPGLEASGVKPTPWGSLRKHVLKAQRPGRESDSPTNSLREDSASPLGRSPLSSSTPAAAPPPATALGQHTPTASADAPPAEPERRPSIFELAGLLQSPPPPVVNSGPMARPPAPVPPVPPSPPAPPAQRRASIEELREVLSAYLGNFTGDAALSMKQARKHCEEALGLPPDSLKERKKELAALLEALNAEMAVASSVPRTVTFEVDAPHGARGKMSQLSRKTRSSHEA